MKLVFLLLYSFFLTTAAKGEEEICPGVVIDGEDINLDATEKKMVCGDKDLAAYRNIPPYQAAFFMTGFLQSRGYLQPQFQTINGVLHVTPGKEAKLNRIILNSQIRKDNYLQKDLEQRFSNQVLNPKLINRIESEALNLLRENGFPCADLESSVDAKTNDMTISLLKTKRHSFGKFQREPVKDLHINAFDRFYPFKSTDIFNYRLLQLTEKRMLRSEVVQVTYFLEECSREADDFSLSQRFIAGPPRTIRYGVGASTELGPMLRLQWSNNRLGSMASSVSARVQGSVRSQSLILKSDSYFWKHRPRRSIVSQFEILRESQIAFEQLLVKLSPASLKWTMDKGNHHWLWTLGPAFEYGTYHSDDNTDTKSFRTGVIEGSLDWMEHDYEFYDFHPQEGDRFNFTFGFRHPGLGFSDQSLRLDSSYVKLSNLGNLGRGEAIGGIRLSAGTLWIDDDVPANALPPNVKFYGGGSDDVRGFQLNTLPRNDGEGAKTKLGLKLELRKTHFGKESIEGFTFLDSAYFGDNSFSTLPQLFYSPGVGIRWFSPIGLVQGYVSRSYSISPTEEFGYFFYAGLGGIF